MGGGGARDPGVRRVAVQSGAARPGIPAVLWFRQWDIARRRVVVFYRVEDAPAVKFQHLTDSSGFVSRVQRVWQVEAQGALHDPYQQKVNAGVGTLVRRRAGSINVAGPPVLITNRQLPVMLYGRLTLMTQSGLLMIWDFSRHDVAASLAEAVNRMR